MKILALTTFVICLICALSLSVESFENIELAGGFTKTCRKYKLTGGILSAECKDKKGKYIAGQINLGGCISNKNGKLTFGGKGFEKSVKGCTFKGTNLKCQTKNKKGKFVPSTLNIDKFVSNPNGLLQCGKVKGRKAGAAKKKKGGKKKKNGKGKGKKKKKGGKAKLGQFAKSCTDLKFNEKKLTLTGNCKAPKGKKAKANLNLANCIANNNGKLVHGKGFKNTKQCKLAKSVLTCQAKDKKGKFKKASIDLNKFIGNMNGKLKC